MHPGRAGVGNGDPACPQRQREPGQHQTRQTERLAPPQQQRQPRQPQRDQDRAVDRTAHQRQRVARAQFGHGQPLRKVQAQHRRDAEQPQRDRKHTAPPAAAEAARRAICEYPGQPLLCGHRARA